MTIDERLERLTERHEALAQALELMQRMSQDQWAETHKAIAELRAAVAETQRAVSKLQITSQQDGENIRALARIAEIHERRLSRLEGDAEEENGR